MAVFSSTLFKVVTSTFNVCPSRSFCMTKTGFHLYALHNRVLVRNNPRLFLSFTRDCSITKCWKCDKSISMSFGDFMCDCGVLQPPNQETSKFKVMNEKEHFYIDQEELTKKFRWLQNKLHPDRFTQKSDKEKEFSQMQSTLVNEAYRTLQDPLLRGLHLLELRGESIDESNKVMDQEFLMEVMELNEELAEIDDVDKYNSVLSKNDETLKQLFSSLADAFSNDDIAGAKSILVKLKYFANLQEKLREQRHLYEF